MSDNVDHLQIHGPTRALALASFKARLASWGISPPTTEPLLEDFGTDDFYRTGLTELWITNQIAAGYCGKYLFIFAGQTCPLHHHKIKHETFFVIQGAIRVSLADQEQELHTGETLAIAPQQIHAFTGLSDADLLELSMPCHVEDNYFTDPLIRRWHQAIVAKLAAGAAVG